MPSSTKCSEEWYEQSWGGIKLWHRTPSVAKTTNSSSSMMRLYEISGTDIRPNSLRQKSPNARAMARPGASLCGSHTLATSGSSRRANIRPLHFRILSSSAEKQEQLMRNDTQLDLIQVSIHESRIENRYSTHQ